jgi:hypothetical protein
VVAGSAFAVAQSVGAGGALPAVGYAISAGITGLSGFFASKSKRGRGPGADHPGNSRPNSHSNASEERVLVQVNDVTSVGKTHVIEESVFAQVSDVTWVGKTHASRESVFAQVSDVTWAGRKLPSNTLKRSTL